MATKSIAQTVNTSNFAGKQKSVLRDLFEANASLNSITPTGGTLAVNGAVSASGNLTLSGGTANGVAYLNGSKVVTSGSTLTFDGTNLGAAGAITAGLVEAVRADSAVVRAVRGTQTVLIGADAFTDAYVGTSSNHNVSIIRNGAVVATYNAAGCAVTGSISATANVTFSGLPTSASGLPSGGLWNDGGTIKIA